jgi:hypothetical protein
MRKSRQPVLRDPRGCGDDTLVMSWRESLKWAILRRLRAIEPEMPRLVAAIVTISVRAPWWRDRTVLAILLFFGPAIRLFCKSLLTHAGRVRFHAWHERNYSSAVLIRKYPWVKYERFPTGPWSSRGLRPKDPNDKEK